MSGGEHAFWTLWTGAIAAFMGVWTGICFRPSWFNRRAAIAADAPAGARFCRDCRWCAIPPGGAFNLPDPEHAKCMHPTSVRDAGTVLVTGKYTPDNQHHCSVMRKSTFAPTGCCGPDGVHWEPRP